MTRRLSAKHKVDRRLGVNLWGRPKSPFNSRNYAPGQHGKKRTSKPSDYGNQLHAKQKLKFYYGNINERQFRNIYKKAINKKGNSTENLVGLLERRLDTVVYRAKFASTVFSSRQLINHGHIVVNGKKVNIPSYQVKEEDSVEIREKSKNLNSFFLDFEQSSTTLLARSFVPSPPFSQCIQRFAFTPSVAQCSSIILTSLSVSVIK